VFKNSHQEQPEKKIKELEEMWRALDKSKDQVEMAETKVFYKGKMDTLRLAINTLKQQ